MQVTVLLFGPAADRAGAPRIGVEVRAHAAVGDLKRAIASQHASLADLVAQGRIAVNCSFAPDDARVGPGDEVALIALVSGG